MITRSQNLENFPTIAECGPSLMMLAPCAPFVQQGTQALPNQSCCASLKEFFEEDQESKCLCLLINNDSSLDSIPVNRTLALQLPILCNVRPNISTCSGKTYKVLHK